MKKMKRQVTENIVEISHRENRKAYIWQRTCTGTYKEVQLNKKPIFKRWKNSNRRFTKEDIWVMTSIPMKKWLALVIKEIQIKATMKYHYTPTGMAKIDNTKCCWECGIGLTKKWHSGTFHGHDDIFHLHRGLAYTGACSC